MARGTPKLMVAVVGALMRASDASATDTGSGIGQAAAEMMKEIQKAQADVQTLDGSAHHPIPEGGDGPWTAERRAHARARRDIGGTVTDQDIDLAISNAAGRLYFVMPTTPDADGPWADYFCVGAVVTDASGNDRSLIMTAAHCIYDDLNQIFARNVLFIPNTVDRGSDSDCEDDPTGCWAPAAGVVDVRWTKASVNAPWDLGYYLVRKRGLHAPPLEVAVGSHPIDFRRPGAGVIDAVAASVLFDLAVCSAIPDDQDVGIIITPASTCE